ncbi:MAG: hypothetical protein AAF828_07590 [Bacteroidota bacterium]
MRIRHYFLFLLGFSLIACQQGTPTESDNTVSAAPTETPFTVRIERVEGRDFLPALHSFILADHEDKWLMLAGRTNGMHGFGQDGYQEKSLPHADFNDSIFVCSTTACQGMSVDFIPMPYQSIFRATNLQHTEVGDALYINGGYGENPSKDNLLERWDTYDYIAKINLPAFINAIEEQDPDAALAAMRFGRSPVIEATGGELYHLDGYFYLVGGHQFNGTYVRGSDKHPITQVYLNAVHKFKIEASGDSLRITEVSKITDGLADDTTQFRRRDHPVTPALQLKDGTLYPSVTLYSGVFTSPNNKIPGLAKNSIFTTPIYVYTDGSYAFDTTFAQQKNVYACANFVAYDGNTEMLYTTLMGGIGDGTTEVGYTNNVMTINRSLTGQATTTTTQDSIPANYRHGAEADMILSDAPKVAAHPMVFDITDLATGESMDIGYFFGGILAEQSNPGGYGRGKSAASNALFSITITRQ